MVSRSMSGQENGRQERFHLTLEQSQARQARADLGAQQTAFAALRHEYNFERPHRGYRTKGRRPAEIFYADAPALLVMKGWDVDEFTPQSVRQ